MNMSDTLLIRRFCHVSYIFDYTIRGDTYSINFLTTTQNMFHFSQYFSILLYLKKN